MSPVNWIVAQIGAREHYAWARALARRRRLDRLYTDIWALGGRFDAALARDDVRQFPAQLAPWLAIRRLVGSRGSRAVTARIDQHIGAVFARAVAADIKRSAPESALLAYSTGALEAVRAVRDRGAAAVVVQIDPARTEDELVADERERFRGWERDGRLPASYLARLAAEWQAASLVVVNSTWSRNALIAQGVAPAKLAVVPLAYEGAVVARTRVFRPPLRVMWVGSVILRKGIQYLIAAARELPLGLVDITVAGPVEIAAHAVAGAPKNMRFIGRVPRDEVASLMAAADVFVFPTISDGFGLTQLEAMAQGLPVITTPSCGEVVIDGDNGVIVPPRDAAALAAAIRSFADDPTRLARMGAAAARTVGRFSLSAQVDALDRALLAL